MIIYFSGTGNSLTIAKDIASKLGEAVVHINKAKKRKAITDDVVGFVFPVYNYDMPNVMKEAIQCL
ncbi:hypothetical protein ACT3CE_13190 [Marinifilum sp. RC60d5]|uniref:hypothetical protein n=1 Tax=Marinifilum sp. RC60d5 TaxID=3458414 RepID=UPI0040374A85